MRKPKLILLIVVLLISALLIGCTTQPSTTDDAKTTETAVVETTVVETAAETEFTEEETTVTEPDAAKETATSADAESPDEEQQVAWPIEVTDHLGRTVEIQEAPQRIVSGYYISTSLMIALGVQDRLVGIEAKADARPIYALAAPELLDLPNVGTAKDFNLEGALALKPDLVVLPIRLKDVIQTLSDMGIPTLGINPESGDALHETIELIGKAVGSEERAEQLLARNQELAERAKKFGEEQGFAEKIYLAGNSSFLSTAGSQMYQSSLITNVGAINVAADLPDTYWADISYEQLLEWQPDLIVLVPEASYTVEDVLTDEAIQSLNAVQEERVYQMPKQFEAWDSPVPSGVLGQLYLASILYPDLYSETDFANDVTAYYQEFYGFTADLSS